MQNNQNNTQNGQQPNPNYPYTQGIDGDYNQVNNNQFPQEFYDDSSNFNPQPQTSQNDNQRSWRAFGGSPSQQTQPQQNYESINDPDSLQNRPESELMPQDQHQLNSQEAYVYSSPTLVHNNGNPGQVVATNIPIVETNKNSQSPENPENIKKEDKNNQPKNIKTKSGVTGLMIAVLILISIISIASSSVVAGLVSFYITKQQIEENSQKSSAISEVTTTRVTDEQSAIIEAVSVARESVVSVIVSKNLTTNSRNRFFDRFFGENSSSNSSNSTSPTQVGAGTGFIVSTSGYILTNKHVVADNTATYSVVLDNGTELKATVLGRDPLLDIAILKVEPGSTALKAIKLGDSSTIKVGQTAIAIGNSLGEFSNSVSRGIVSGLGRNITAGSDISENVETLEGVIQTDASINPGNSGGPLLDANGFVIGVNVAKSDGADNVSFSIPINDVKQLLENVISTGKLQRPYLGIQYLLLDKDLAKEENISVDYGAYLFTGDSSTSIAKDSPASKAGLKEKDVILEINGSKITQDNDLRKLVQKAKVGDVLTLKVLREGNQLEIKATLEELKE